MKLKRSGGDQKQQVNATRSVYRCIGWKYEEKHKQSTHKMTDAHQMSRNKYRPKGKLFADTTAKRFCIFYFFYHTFFCSIFTHSHLTHLLLSRPHETTQAKSKEPNLPSRFFIIQQII
jgi:hypothetical protein